MDHNQQSQSTVERCGVTMCTYNQNHHCTAGSVTIDMVEGMAHCVTFTARDGATGIGSTSVSERTDARRDDSAR